MTEKSRAEGKQHSFFQFDPITFLSMLALMIIGVMFIYSSNVTSAASSGGTREYIAQIVWIVGAIVIYFLLQLGEYDRLERISYYIYAALIILLVVTLLWGKMVNGARSWLGIFGFGIQPSEFMKLGFIIALSSFYSNRRQSIDSLGSFLLGALFLLPPLILVMLQPDLGTSLVYFPLFLAVSYVAGVKKRYVFFLLFAGLFMVFFAVLPVWESKIMHEDLNVLRLFEERELILFTTTILLSTGGLAMIGFFVTKRFYFYWLSYGFSIAWSSLLGSFLFRIFLKDYQIMRLIVFLNPEVDPRGSGWNIIQSLTEIGKASCRERV